MPVIDAPVVAKAIPVSQNVYVTVPEDDIFEQRHPDIVVNGTKYAPGSHFVAPELAGTINERVRLYARSQARLNSSRPDSKAQAITNKTRGMAGGTTDVSSLS